MWRTLCSVVPVLLALALGSGAARADEARDPAAAEELFRRGRAAAQKKDFAGACAKFRESNRLDPAVGTLFNIADCEEKLGRLATSWTLFREVAQRLPSDDDRRAIADARARALEPRVPTLSIHLTAPARADVVVRRDGVELGKASLDTALPVDPGEHAVVVDAPGSERALFSRQISEGEHAALDVRVGASASTPPAPPELPSPALHAAPAAPARPSHTAAYVVGGVGVAGIITGVVAGFITLSKKSTVDANCTGKVCSAEGLDAARSGKTFGVITTAGLVTGAVGLGAATYLFLSTPVDESPRSSAYLVGIRAKW